jgi:hypothetical protein
MTGKWYIQIMEETSSTCLKFFEMKNKYVAKFGLMLNLAIPKLQVLKFK